MDLRLGEKHRLDVSQIGTELGPQLPDFSANSDRTPWISRRRSAVSFLVAGSRSGR